MTAAGEVIQFTSNTSSNPPSYRTGKRVEVPYRLLVPHDAKINAFGSLFRSSFAAGIDTLAGCMPLQAR